MNPGGTGGKKGFLHGQVKMFVHQFWLTMNFSIKI